MFGVQVSDIPGCVGSSGIPSGPREFSFLTAQLQNAPTCHIPSSPGQVPSCLNTVPRTPVTCVSTILPFLLFLVHLPLTDFPSPFDLCLPVASSAW